MGRLFVTGKVLGYRRSRHNQKMHTSLLSIDNVKTYKDCDFYLGKRVAYIYRCKTLKKGTNVRIMWGRITRPHGNNGVVRAKFSRNLPPYCMGKPVRIMLYPSRI